MILVTGCAGFIGSHFCESLLKEGKRVLGVDNFDRYYDDGIKKANITILKKFENFTFFPVDITDKSNVDKLFSKYHFSIVVHLAARPGVAASLKDPLPYAKVNIIGTLVLLEQMKKLGDSVQFIFGSSSSVYGGLKKMPFSEDGSTKIQLSPYGASKRAGELYCRFYHDLYGIPITILRFFTVYGPRVRPDMAIAKFIKAIKNRDKITLYNRGEVERDYTYIDDIVSGIRKAMDKRLSFEIINLGGSHPVKIIKIMKLLEQYLGKKAKVKNMPLPRSEMSKTWADIRKARKILLWKPRISIEEGIEELINWYKHEKNLQ